MRLSAEMYEQIVAGLKSDSQRDKDKRQEPRVGLAAEAEFVTVSAEGVRTAGVVRVRDVSASGIGLFFPNEVAKNQRFVVQLYTNNDQPLWLVCTAAYCRRVDGGRHSVGGKINQLLRADQIQKLEAQAAVAAPPIVMKPAKPIPMAAVSDIERISKAILG
jgi:hypothetical protein